jgi:hypothetical protein
MFKKLGEKMMIQEKNKREKELKRIKGTTRLGQSPNELPPFTDCLGSNHIDYTTLFIFFL